MALDPWMNLAPKPPYLAQAGSREKELWRVVLFAPALFLAAALVGFVAFSLFSDLAETLPGLIPEVVKGLISPLIAPVKAGEVAPDLGLIGATRRVLLEISGHCGALVALPALGFLLLGRAPLSWFTSTRRFRWRLLAAGLVLYGAASGVFLVLDGLMHGFPKAPPLFRADEPVLARLVYFLATLFAFIIAAAAEEAVTRGWVMQQTAAFTASLPLILGVNAAVFVFMHLDQDPARNLALAASATALGMMAIRTGGLEFGIGVHAANNLLIAWFSSLDRVTDLSGHLSPADLAIQLSVIALGYLACELCLRNRTLRALTAPGSPDAGPSG